jgi:transposase-like protein
MNSEIDKKIIELRLQGYSRNDISSILHLNHNYVQKVLRENNLSGKQGFHLKDKAIIEKYKDQIKNEKVFRQHRPKKGAKR